jgi:hydroxyacylglutathione hydrolase
MLAPVRCERISGKLVAVRSPASCFYAVTDGGTTILIDTGLNPRWAARGLERCGVPARSVSHVFLTHSDGDHIGGLGLFPDAVVCMSAHEQAVIDGTVPRTFLFLKRRNRFERRYVALEDEAVVTAGPFRIRAIWTPGHTPGSACFLVDGSALFTGDLLGLRGGRARPGPRLLCNDVEENERSIRKLAARVPQAELLCTGHGGWTRAYRQAMAGYLPADGGAERGCLPGPPPGSFRKLAARVPRCSQVWKAASTLTPPEGEPILCVGFHPSNNQKEAGLCLAR